MTKVVHYRETDVAENVDLTEPEKICQGVYFSYASIKGHKGAVYLKTPSMKVESCDLTSDTCTITARCREDSPLKEFADKLDTRCKDVIYQNSAKFFNGRRFSEGKIQNSYKSTLSDCCMKVHLEDADIRDQRDTPRNADEIAQGQEIIMVVRLDGVSYTPTSMEFIVTAQQIKVYIDEKLHDWMIKTDDEVEDKIAQIPDKTHESQESIASTGDDSLPELPEQTEAEIESLSDPKPDNDDDKNLF